MLPLEIKSIFNTADELSPMYGCALATDEFIFFNPEEEIRAPTTFETPKPQQTDPADKLGDSEIDDEDVPLILRQRKASSAKNSNTNDGQRPRRASAQKRKKPVQTVVISSSEGKVSDEDSSPSSEWNGSDTEGPSTRRTRKKTKGDPEFRAEEEQDEEWDSSSSKSGSKSHSPESRQKAKVRHMKRTSRGQGPKTGSQKRFFCLFSHSYFH